MNDLLIIGSKCKVIKVYESDGIYIKIGDIVTVIQFSHVVSDIVWIKAGKLLQLPVLKTQLEVIKP